jgi:hypothetical protein
MGGLNPGSKFGLSIHYRVVGAPPLVECRRENVTDERIGVGGKKLQVPPLRTPDFLWTLMALADLMRLSLRGRPTRGLV